MRALHDGFVEDGAAEPRRRPEPDGLERGRRARAALLLASLLFALALPPPAPAGRLCRARRARARGRATRDEVGCARAGRILRGPARLLFGERLDPNPPTRDARGAAGHRACARRGDRRGRAALRELGELARVPGIGPRTLARIRPLLVVQAD